jgi:hypothetical protein
VPSCQSNLVKAVLLPCHKKNELQQKQISEQVLNNQQLSKWITGYLAEKIQMTCRPKDALVEDALPDLHLVAFISKGNSDGNLTCTPLLIASCLNSKE